MDSMLFNSYACLTQQPNIHDSLISTYQRVFKESKAWNEDYTVEQVDDRLKLELAGSSALCVALLPGTDTAIGFSWAQLLDSTQICEAVLGINFLVEKGSPVLEHRLKIMLGNQKTIYSHDTGVLREHRRHVRGIWDILYPVINSLEGSTEITTTLYWTVKKSAAYKLAPRIGFSHMMEVDYMQWFGRGFVSEVESQVA